MTTSVFSRPFGSLLGLAAGLLLTAGCAGSAATTAPPPPEAETLALLARMPAGTTTEENALCTDLLAGGQARILDVCRQLLPPGQTAGADSSARFALEGLARWAGRPGAAEDRALFEQALLAALEAEPESEVRAFLLARLQPVASDEAVPTAASFLADERLCEPAARILIALGSDAAGEALLTALPRSAGATTLTLVKALGDLRFAPAVYEIWRHSASPDRALREAALYALASIGPVSTPDLLAEASSSGPPSARARALSYRLLYARRLAEAGDEAGASALCREIVRDAAQPVSARIAALNTEADLVGSGAFSDMVHALQSGQPQLQAAVADLVARIPGENATLYWLNYQAHLLPGLRGKIRTALRARVEDWPIDALLAAIPVWDDQLARMAWAEQDSTALVAEGFECLFNGRDLTGWIGDTIGYVVEDGMIVVDPQRRGGGGNLYTAAEYDDFIFRFQFRLTPGANNGLGIRAPLEGDAAYVGMELQILDNYAEQYAELQPYQYHGSIYGVVPARRRELAPAGEWNTQEVIADGRHITVILNGTVIVDADLYEAGTPATMDGRDHPGLARNSGHIGFLGHGSQVEFRKIWIKSLADPEGG